MAEVSPQLFKIANLVIGSLATVSALTQFSYIFGNFTAFLMSFYALALSVPVVYLEFRVPPNLYRFASFYFSFIGRGLTYILLSLLLSFGGVFKVLVAALLFIFGVLFVVLEFIPSIQEPENFRPEGNSIAVGEDEDDII
ncbi:LAFE_0H09868g1_1 [Lachancea fermentati]|uniref:LAFE_0H09868g1_1 n=1 Tax=Lachancea fermentati TaxID=4955 RepID=A0A1G4MK58_LACFM|nr:LAFE_0H09868g1_1 [Lachancea fermentati]